MGYDRRLSPLTKAGYNGYILGQGGLIDAVGGAFKNMGNNPLGSLFSLGYIAKQYNDNKKVRGSLGRQATNQLYQQLTNDLQSSTTNNLIRKVEFQADVANATPGPYGAGALNIGQQYPYQQNDQAGNPMPEIYQTGGGLPAKLYDQDQYTPDIVQTTRQTGTVLPEPALSEEMPQLPIAYNPQYEITAGRQINSTRPGPPIIPIPEQVSYSGIFGYPTDIGLSLGGGITPNQRIVNSGGGGGRDIEFSTNDIERN